MAKGTKGTKGDVTFFGEESNKEPVCDVKVKLIKLEGGTAAPPPRGRENLALPGLEQAPPSHPFAFPLGLASPALASSCAACCPADGGWATGAEHSEADEGKRSFLHIESAATKRLPLGGEAVSES